MFSPSLVRIVVIPDGFNTFAAAMASSIVSPGMNFDTERRTNAFFVAVSRSQTLVEAQRKTLRIIDHVGLLNGGIIGYRTSVIDYRTSPDEMSDDR